MPSYPDELRDLRIIAVGWSDAQERPIGFYHDTAANDGGEIDGYVMTPLPDEEQEDHLRRQKCLLDDNLRLRDFDPVRHGLPIMEAQRRMKISPPCADMEEGISIVGGHVLVTEVSRSGVRQHVAHRWADAIGEHIQPAPIKAPAQSAMVSNIGQRNRRPMEHAR